MRILPKKLRARLHAFIRGNDPKHRPSPDEFIPSMAIERHLADSKRVLVVGDAMGRDCELLTSLGKEVSVLDIVPLENVPNFVQQSITERTPFEDGFFDGVVMAEVLEHLFEDFAALDEVRRILKDDGVLVLTVPYISNRQDEAPFHVRVYTPRTIERLLANSGFRIEDHFWRGLVCRLAQIPIAARCFVFAPRLLLKLLLGERGLVLYRRMCFGLERWLGSTRVIRRLQRAFTSYGGVMKVVKGERVDFTKAQIAEFSGRWTRAGQKRGGS